MELFPEADCCPRPVRFLFSLALAVVAIVSFRKEKRSVAALAAIGAAVLGYTAVAGSPNADDESEPDAAGSEPETTDTTARDPTEMRCAVCDEPIVVGQSRRPDPNNDIVHEVCLDAPK